MMFTLDPYAARSCPVKTHNAFHPGMVLPIGVGPGRQPGSAEFTTATLDRIIAGDASVVDLRTLTGEPSQAQEAACLEAMAAGTRVIIGGLLPRDWAEHRSGRVDLLVREASGGYFPGLVKLQRVLDARKGELPATFSSVANLPARFSALGWRYRWHWRWGNALQLAHLWHLLSATGHQATTPLALIVGSDEVDDQGLRAIWIDLAE
ncbi:MAG: hypothetical protein ACOH1Y_07670, partial [Propionicimonas sp.]